MYAGVHVGIPFANQRDMIREKVYTALSSIADSRCESIGLGKITVINPDTKEVEHRWTRKNPEGTEKYIYDSDTHINGNIFIKGNKEAIEITNLESVNDEGKEHVAEFTPSKKANQLLDLRLTSELFNAGRGWLSQLSQGGGLIQIVIWGGLFLLIFYQVYGG